MKAHLKKRSVLPRAASAYVEPNRIDSKLLPVRGERPKTRMVKGERRGDKYVVTGKLSTISDEELARREAALFTSQPPPPKIK